MKLKHFGIWVCERGGKAVFEQGTDIPSVLLGRGKEIVKVPLCKMRKLTSVSDVKSIKPNKPKIGAIYEINEEFIGDVKLAASQFSFFYSSSEMSTLIDDKPLFYVVSNKGGYARFEFSYQGWKYRKEDYVSGFFDDLARIFAKDLPEDVKTYSCKVDNTALGFCEKPEMLGLGFHFLNWLEDNKVFTPV